MFVLPPYSTRQLIHERLDFIFPEGTPNRQYCTRIMAASTVFTMLYIGAVEGNEVYIGPIHVYRMTEEQSNLTTDDERLAYPGKVSRNKVEGLRWYADNTREPIRDETLKEGLVQAGAVISLSGLPTTSSKPRYALQKDFAALFDPKLTGDAFTKAVSNWQEQNLSASARARIMLAGRVSGSGQVTVKFPNGESRNLSAGPSSEISKAVVEVFAANFLKHPAVLWLSTSDAKVSYQDDRIASGIGLDIKADKVLPDIILVDLAETTLLVFVEVVATDGAMTVSRQRAIYELTDKAGFKREHIVFVTAYHDRQSPGFKKTIPELAWNSFAWFLSEPDNIVHFKEEAAKIQTLLHI